MNKHNTNETSLEIREAALEFASLEISDFATRRTLNRGHRFGRLLVSYGYDHTGRTRPY